MTHGRERTGSARSLTLAAVGIAGAAVLVALVLVLGRTPARSTPINMTAQGTIPPDIKDVPATQTSRGVTQVGAGKGMYVQVADRNDPGRVAGELIAESSEPLESRRYLLTRPRAWAYLADGRTLYAEADSGRAFIPDTGAGSRPEEGTLKGNVIVRLFPAMDRRPDPAKDAPELTVTTQSLAFNGTLGELRFDEAVDFLGERFTFRGRGIVVLFNEARRQLELLRVEEPLSPLTILAAARNHDIAPPPSPAKTNTGAGPQSVTASTVPARTPIQTTYRLVAQRDIHLTHGARELWSDRAEAWIRLYDNKLREGALGAAHRTHPRFAPDFRSIGGVVAALALATNQPEINQVSSRDEPVMIRWSGPLEIRPTPSDTTELASNDVFARFVGDDAGRTRIADSAGKAHAHARLFEYGATRREASLIEVAPALARVTLTDRGYATSSRFDVNMGSGEVRVPDAGRLLATAADAESPERSVAWTREASFMFDTDSDMMSSRLREARMVGGVVATDSRASLGGDSLSAAFVSDDADSPRLSFLKIIGDAVARDGRDGSMAADTIGITFAKGQGEDPEPTQIDAHGHIHASRPGTTLEADTLSASLARDDSGNISPTTILATGSVRYEGDDAVVANTSRLEADVRAQTASLLGEGSSVARGQTSVTGAIIRLAQSTGQLEVQGPGRFAHASPNADTGDELATAQWTRSMRFDDQAGTVRCEGDVTALWARGVLERHTMGGQSVAIDLQPKAATSPDDTGLPRDTLTPQQRDVRLVTISGDAAPGWLELRRYAPDDHTPPRVERELRLTGPLITGDVATGVISVDGEGTCRLLDLRAQGEGDDDASRAGPMGGTLRGAARFTWMSGMRYERREGTLTMRDRVTLTHVRLDENFRTELDCDLLVARVRESTNTTPPTPLSDDFRGELTSATATGNVWMRSNAKEVTAASLEYDALRRIADARANAGGTIVYLDPASGSPVEAERAIWDLGADRVELRGVRTIVSPR